MQLDQEDQLAVGPEPTQCTNFSVSPVLKNASMSPASFAASSAPSPELMAATTRTWHSASPEQTVPLQKKSTRKVAQKSLPTRQKRHCGHADSYGDSHTASSAICGSPSLGGWVVVNVIGQRSAGGGTGFLLGSGAEGRVAVAAVSGTGGAGSELGRIFVGFRKRARRLGHQGTTARRASFACACAFQVSEM